MITGDTIAAIATAPGRGGVAVVRVSGPEALTIAEKVTSASGRMVGWSDGRMTNLLTARHALFYDLSSEHRSIGASEQVRNLSWSDCFGEAVCEAALKDERIVALTAGMKDGTGLADFAAAFPKRFYDLGICEGREKHHLVSGRIIRETPELSRWFSPEQIETIAQAAEDHRASGKGEPRTIYGRIIAEADRDIVPMKIIRRTIQFGLDKYPELDREGHWNRTLEHLHEKYAEGGYLKLWIPESPNGARLAELRMIIADAEELRKIFDVIYDEETAI